MTKPDKPGYFEKLEQTQRLEHSINSVLTQDPVISQRSPQELVPIIRTLIEMAPDLVAQPPVLASILRQATSGQYETLDPMTLGQIAESQVKLMQAQELKSRLERGEEPNLRL